MSFQTKRFKLPALELKDNAVKIEAVHLSNDETADTNANKIMRGPIMIYDSGWVAIQSYSEY